MQMYASHFLVLNTLSQRSHCRFSVELGGPVFTLDIIKQGVYVKDTVAGKNVTFAPLSAFEDRTLQHTMSVRTVSVLHPSTHLQDSLSDQVWAERQDQLRNHRFEVEKPHHEVQPNRCSGIGSNLVGVPSPSLL